MKNHPHPGQAAFVLPCILWVVSFYFRKPLVMSLRCTFCFLWAHYRTEKITTTSGSGAFKFLSVINYVTLCARNFQNFLFDNGDAKRESNVTWIGVFDENNVENTFFWNDRKPFCCFSIFYFSFPFLLFFLFTEKIEFINEREDCVGTDEIFLRHYEFGEIRTLLM